RREYTKRRVELAKEVLGLFYEAADAIRYIRTSGGEQEVASVLDQPGGVVFFDPVDVPRLTVLAPAFVERHPHHDRRVVAAGIDHPLQLECKLLLRGGVAIVAGGHVLPDQDAQLV